MTSLNVDTLPFDTVYPCKDGTEINMAEFLASHRPAIEALAGTGLIKANESFGFAMAKPQPVNNYTIGDNWDKPEEFVWFVGGWGPDRDRYIANAIRKMRGMLRKMKDSTLEMRFEGSTGFEDVVDSTDDDGKYPWGDYPWAGALSIELLGFYFDGGTSCLDEVEDHAVTLLIFGLLASKIAKGDGLLSDD